jgi:hypothetical protein
MKLKDMLNEHYILGELPSSKLMKMKWNPVTQKDPIQELTGYDDPNFPKAKYQKVDKAMVDLTKALVKADVNREAIEALFTNMAVRMAKMYGKK